jgi:ribosomal protein S12 methylthiotransferase accessory factor
VLDLLPSAWLERALGMVGPGGPVQELARLPRGPLDPPLHVWGGRIAADLEASLPESADRLVASGISHSERFAMAAAVGEACERYAFALYHASRPDPEVFRTDDVSPDLLFELPFLLPGHVDRRRWAHEAATAPKRMVSARRMTDGGPEEQCSLPVEILVAGDRPSLLDTTNGLAAGDSFENAAASAIREVVERDALMLVWHYRTGGSRLPLDVLPIPYARMTSDMAARGVCTLLQDITVEAPYRVVLATVSGAFPSEGEPRFSIGSGSHADLGAAAAHAFREACLGWRSQSWLPRPSADDHLEHPPADMPASFVDHAQRYTTPEMSNEVRFLFEPREDGDPDRQPCRQGAAGDGEGPTRPEKREVFLIDLTPPDVEAMGLRVVKAVVPGLLPLEVGALGSGDLVSSRLPASVAGTVLNSDMLGDPAPHPWP